MSVDLRIADHALIGNGQSAALVSRDGAVAWCCWPRFDSPALFCRLLDAERGGFFRVAPTADARVERAYAPGTNVLRTTSETAAGRITLTDLMPAPADRPDARDFPHQILRRVECEAGAVEFEVRLRPTFDFGRVAARLECVPGGAVAYGDGEALGVSTGLPLRVDGDALVARARLTAGEVRWVALTHGPPPHAERSVERDVAHLEDELCATLHYWRQWSDQCTYDGPHRDAVLRSALTLKLLVFQPTGGIIAAPTTSLPADPGGVRNWDYSFTWLRDAGLVLDALQRIGYHDETVAFIDWLEALCLRGDCDLGVLYTVDGEAPPPERTLDHLAGHRDARPVRVGNAAAQQRQIDCYGHVVDAVVLCYERMPRTMRDAVWAFLRDLVGHVAARWRAPDQGPWELREPPRHHVYSKLYCWVAFDRALRLARSLDLPADLDAWAREKAALRDAILGQGYDDAQGTFVRAFDEPALDASVLALPLAGLLPVDDARMTSTVARLRAALAADGLMYRYRDDDGLEGRDATFTLCSFWLVRVLARAGRVREATAIFERILNHANDVGLLSEQIDPESGALLGNFPQGFAHLGLIRAALDLQRGGDA